MKQKDTSHQSYEPLTICRCEGVTLGQLKDCIHHSGVRTVNQVKKLTRAGMGPCQGRTCAGVVEKILAVEAEIPLGTEPLRSRPPVRGIHLGVLAAPADEFAEPAGPVSVAMLRTTPSKTTTQQPESEESD
jgi:bacterioferritin-associated ferredoxin